MATKRQIEELASRFSNEFSDGVELGQKFRADDEKTAEEITDQALRSEKFPIDANMYNTKIDIIISNGMSDEEWAESYIEAHNIGTSEEFQQALNDDLYFFIADNLNKTKISVKIHDSLKEWLEKHGTVEYLAEEMEKAYEENELEEIIPVEDKTEVDEKLRQALSEEGFPSDTDVDEIEYLINNVKLTTTYEALAEKHIDDIESSGSVQNYINNRFYQDIIKDDAYNFEVEITSDPEEFQEQ